MVKKTPLFIITHTHLFAEVMLFTKTPLLISHTDSPLRRGHGLEADGAGFVGGHVLCNGGTMTPTQ